MPILLGLLALTIVVGAMVQWPKLRMPGGITLAVVAVAVVALFQINPRYDIPEITPQQVILSDVTFVQDPRLTTVQGRVANTSDTAILAKFTLQTQLHDCPTATLSDTCIVIGENRTTIYPDVPAGQVRAFTATLRFMNLPPLVGVPVWDTQLVEVGSRSVAQVR